MPRIKTKLCCTFLNLFLSGCGLFNPQEPEAFGDLQVNVRFAELSRNGSTVQTADLVKENWPVQAQALDRFVITISAYVPQLEQLGQELVRREIFIGEDRRVRAAVRVPLRGGEESFFMAEVQGFERFNLIYSGSDVFQFDASTRTATVDVALQPVAFFASFSSQPNSPRFVLGQAFASDSLLTTFDFSGNGIGVTVPVGRASQALNPILLWGDTTTVRVRAWRNLIFQGESSQRFSYAGPPADVLAVCTWNQPLNFDLEIINPQQQPISEASPGDVPNGSGVMQATDNSYGPEVFEWRVGRMTSGPFIVNVVRQNLTETGNGTVYVIRRERTQQQTIEAIPFEFRLIDVQNTKQVFSFNWP
ncbi:MAG: hypothetical protein ACREOO_14300 [bacterium]